VLPLIAVSGVECIAALTQAGFRPLRRTDDATTLRRGGREVVVPHAAILSPEELVAVIQAAGFGYGDFLDLLSEAPTDPDVLGTLRPKRPAARD